MGLRKILWNFGDVCLSSPKVRYAAKGHGKRGGIRVIYYWLRDDGQIYMLLAYPKSEKDDLTDKETALLRDFVKDVSSRG